MDNPTNMFDESIQENETDSNKAFAVEGVKAFDYVNHNLLVVTEAGSKLNYTVEWLFIKRILGVLNFTEKQVKTALDAMLNYHRVVIDFNNNRIFLPVEKPRVDRTIKAIHKAVTEYDPEIQKVFGDNPEDYDNWYSI